MTQQIWKYVWVTVIILVALQLCSQQVSYKKADTETGNNESVNKQLIVAPELPDKMEFAGEPVPLHVPDVAERLDRELLVNSYLHGSTLLGLKRMQRHLPEIKRLLKEEDIPEDFIYLALAESLFGQVTSHAGAAGFWQLMPETARGYGLIVNNSVDERFNIEKSTVAATKYLKRAKSKFNTWTNAAASYNRGMGGLDRALEKQGVSSYYDLYLNDETSRYMFRILALKEVLGNPEKYGFQVTEDQAYKPIPTREVKVSSSIPDLPAYALEQGTNYKTLRLLNPWIKGYSLPIASGQQFTLNLPQ